MIVYLAIIMGEANIVRYLGISSTMLLLSRSRVSLTSVEYEVNHEQQHSEIRRQMRDDVLAVWRGCMER
jgi:precorrin-6B methylase 1